MIAREAASYPTSLTHRDLQRLTLEELYRVHDEVLSSFLRDLASGCAARKSSDEASLLDLKICIAEKQLEQTCGLCVRGCSKRPGFCRVRVTRIGAARVVMEDEEFLVPNYGIFFTGCNLRCRFCQSWDIAFYPDNGRVVEICNLVENVKFALQIHGQLRYVKLSGGEPTLHLPYILKLVRELIRAGLSIDIALETNLIVSEKTLRLLVGVFDLFIVDVKTGRTTCAERLLGLEVYPEVLRRNLAQLRDLGQRLHLRHLILPGHVDCCTESALKLVRELDLNAKLTLLTTYTPPIYLTFYEKSQLPELPFSLDLELVKQLRRAVPKSDIERAREIATCLGLDLIVI